MVSSLFCASQSKAHSHQALSSATDPISSGYPWVSLATQGFPQGHTEAGFFQEAQVWI